MEQKRKVLKVQLKFNLLRYNVTLQRLLDPYSFACVCKHVQFGAQQQIEQVLSLDEDFENHCRDYYTQLIIPLIKSTYSPSNRVGSCLSGLADLPRMPNSCPPAMYCCPDTRPGFHLVIIRPGARSNRNKGPECSLVVRPGADTGRAPHFLNCLLIENSPTTSDMKYLLLATLAVLLFVQAMAAVPYPPPLDRNLSEDYNDNNLENFLGRADKRACIRRGGGCDGKPNDCCANSSCRCNLWGTNCRCERAGLFQQWGK
ncbi:uncharacterized protein CDAR_105671 [Caerostris darwini]|uniref:Uncharacterized protein n=1 Tax=Caerostris darwini TaxID=1538125 RepID=A0AAV4V1C1_9ARAC|nr:uncharacterized protein CDAR_105671 [Caerostris darwini]